MIPYSAEVCECPQRQSVGVYLCLWCVYTHLHLCTYECIDTKQYVDT